MNDSGKYGADQHAHKGIFEHDQQIGKLGDVSQRADGAAHEVHSEHEDRKPDQNPSHIFSAGAFGGHDHGHAYHGENGREIFRLEQPEPKDVALNAGKGEDPGSEGCADVGAHDDAHRLPELHDA